MLSSNNTKQPKAIPSQHPFIWDLVYKDMQERDLMGKSKHGVRLQSFNGRDTLVDAYQEALDLVAYLRSEIYEREQTKKDNFFATNGWKNPEAYKVSIKETPPDNQDLFIDMLANLMLKGNVVRII